MSSSAASFGTLRVLPRFAFALGESNGTWSATDHETLRLGFHAIRAIQQRMDGGSLDEAFRRPLLEGFGHDSDDASSGTVSRVSPRTRDTIRYLAKSLLIDDAPDALIDAFADFSSRLRIDDLHALALDAFLVLGDILGFRNDERAVESRCIAGVLAISADEWDTSDAILSDLRRTPGRAAEGGAWNLEARRAFVRGNLPAAERAARASVSLLDVSKPSTVASLAYHTLGVVMGAQGRHREATSALFEAYRLAPDPYRAQWALNGLAVGLFQLGRFDAAEDCCALLEDAENANMRGHAYLTSIRIAARRGNRAQVAELRSKCETLLERHVLIAETSAKLCYAIGAASQHLGETDFARSFWHRGLTIARTYGVNHTAYLLDVALNTGRVDADILGPLPLPRIGTEGTDVSNSELANVERRLRVERAAYELAVIG